MKQFFIKTALFIILTLGPSVILQAEGFGNRENILFKIERSRDADVIHYEANLLDDGTLNVENPIRIYWLKHTKNGKTAPLTKVQQGLAYGLKILEVTQEKVEFQFVSFDQHMTLRKNENGNYRVSTQIKGLVVEVERIYVRFSGGSYWFPKIGQVEIYAIIPDAGETLFKVIKP
jgi:hypothetical protein